MTMYDKDGKALSEQDEIRAKIENRFGEINGVIKTVVKAKNEYRAKLAELASDQAASVYTADYIAALRRQAEADYRALRQSLYPDFVQALEGLYSFLSLSQANLDLSNPALSNALKMIEIAGASLDYETAQKINANFAGNQAALKAIQTLYKSAGCLDGGIGKMVYSLSDAVSQIANTGNAVLNGDASINQLSGLVEKLAGMEGFSVEIAKDLEGVTEAARQGAGLF